MDEDGYFWFESRLDDVIKSAGYRIGPSEIEESLLKHAAVAQVGVVGAPDSVRGQVVMAYVVVARGVRADGALEEELKDHVRRRLAAYQYPRIVKFVDELPLTTSGKINRAELRRRAQEV
jgi:acetyl-CoA synthetase